MAKSKYRIKFVWKKYKKQFFILPSIGILTYNSADWDWYEYIPSFAISFAWLVFGFKVEFDELSSFADSLPCHRRETMLDMEVKN